MLGVPAQITGCQRTALVCPPDKNGQLANEVLVAADLCGISEIYTVGGAQAIAIDHEQDVLFGGSDPRRDGCAIGWLLISTEMQLIYKHPFGPPAMFFSFRVYCFC